MTIFEETFTQNATILGSVAKEDAAGTITIIDGDEIADAEIFQPGCSMGIRFTALTIKRPAQIVDARLRIWSRSGAPGCNAIVRAEPSVEAAPIGSGARDLTRRFPGGEPIVEWPNWGSGHNPNDSPNLAHILRRFPLDHAIRDASILLLLEIDPIGTETYLYGSGSLYFPTLTIDYEEAGTRTTGSVW